jgi:hypothetical protein
MATVTVASLGRWQAPSAWDRILQDEPLDPIKGKWVQDHPVVATAGEVTITTANGFATNIEAGTRLTLSYNYGNEEHYVVTGTTDERLLVGQRSGMSMGAMVPYMTCTACYNNEPLGDPEHQPYGRNHQERRILKALPKDRLRALIKKVEKAEGPRDRNPTRWNAAFWDLVTPPERIGGAQRRRGTSRSR